jgi:hypothetical protein
MHPITRPLLLLHPDKVFRERVRRASGHDYEVRQVTTWVSLREAVRESAPGALVVADPFADTNRGGTLSPAHLALISRSATCWGAPTEQRRSTSLPTSWRTMRRPKNAFLNSRLPSTSTCEPLPD